MSNDFDGLLWVTCIIILLMIAIMVVWYDTVKRKKRLTTRKRLGILVGFPVAVYVGTSLVTGLLTNISPPGVPIERAIEAQYGLTEGEPIDLVMGARSIDISGGGHFSMGSGRIKTENTVTLSYEYEGRSFPVTLTTDSSTTEFYSTASTPDEASLTVTFRDGETHWGARWAETECQLGFNVIWFTFCDQVVTTDEVVISSNPEEYPSLNQVFEYELVHAVITLTPEMYTKNVLGG